tara:strand:+ start:803 stop:1012 length:210 start_codon:yes stop_codon:yes gene_type:complete
MVGSLSLFGGGNEVHLIPDRLVQTFVLPKPPHTQSKQGHPGDPQQHFRYAGVIGDGCSAVVQVALKRFG